MMLLRLNMSWTDIPCSRGKYFPQVQIEELFKVIHEAHVSNSNGGRTHMVKEVGTETSQQNIS